MAVSHCNMSVTRHKTRGSPAISSPMVAPPPEGNSGTAQDLAPGPKIDLQTPLRELLMTSEGLTYDGQGY